VAACNYRPMKETADKTHISTDPFLSSQRSGATVALFGEVLADVFPDRSVLGGAPFNVARHLKAFGLNPVLISRTGNDALRDGLLEAMAACGMETVGVQVDHSYPTGQVQIHLENGTHRFEILPDQAYDHINADEALGIVNAIQPQLLYFGSLAQRHSVSRSALRKLLDESHAPAFFDVNLRSPWYDKETLDSSLQRAATVKLNDEELGILAQQFGLPGDTLSSQAQGLMQTYGIEQLLVTCGAHGARLVQREGGEVNVSPTGAPVTVVDTVGAGDGFSAVFILGKLQGWPIEQTLARAHAFAAAICTLRGAIPEQADFYEPFLSGWRT